MARLTLQYWSDDGGFVGRLKEVPGVISQGDTLDELRENIVDAYLLMQSDTPKLKRSVKTTPILVPA